MYNTFLSHTQLNGYISLLLKRNTLEYNNISITYKVTEKGEQYIAIHRQLIELLYNRIAGSSISKSTFFFQN